MPKGTCRQHLQAASARPALLCQTATQLSDPIPASLRTCRGAVLAHGRLDGPAVGQLLAQVAARQGEAGSGS